MEMPLIKLPGQKIHLSIEKVVRVVVLRVALNAVKNKKFINLPSPKTLSNMSRRTLLKFGHS